ncbi:hypothetical protein K438DRAFT_1880257 [Mycena galopus ATCC 62051]|nr:hypothetical protein K438DRAFT_1880257 [Mycena galopus ATCC 62051]
MPYIESFLADKLAIASFRHLRVLEIDLEGTYHDSGTSITRLHACISAFPAVDDLTLNIFRCEEGPVPSTSLAPQLRAYKGSMPFIDAVDLRSTMLRTLSFTNGNAGGLLRLLRKGGSMMPTSITSFTIPVSFKDLTAGSVLCDMLSFFPNLHNLTMVVFLDPRLFRRNSAEHPSLAELGDRLATVLGDTVPALEKMTLD